MITSKTFKEIFKVGVPKGKLFYPCCNGDAYEPISLFIDSIDEFHFSDINKSQLELPVLESLEGIRKDAKVVCTNENINLNNFLRKNFEVDFGSFNIVDNVEKHIWNLEGKNPRDIEIFKHSLDSAITLMSLEEISVFFHRGNSSKDTISDQLWMGKDLLEIVIDKMVDGGIILTDGSGYSLEEWNTPWKSLIETSEVKEDFRCFRTNFKYIGEIKSETGTVYAWCVRK